MHDNDSHAGRHPWLGVELRHLATLEAIGTEGSFRGAATRLGYVQSAVSQQIATLEQIVGTRLVERTRGRRAVALTPAGCRLAEHGASVVAQLHAARADLASIGEHATYLRAAIDDDLAPALLPALLRHTLDARPPLLVRFRESTATTDAHALIGGGELDVAIGEHVPGREDLVAEPLLDDPYVLLAARGSALAERSAPPTVAQLATLRYVAEPPVALHARLESGADRLDVTCRTRSASTVQTLVAADLGVAIVPRLAARGIADEVAAIPLDGVLPTRRIDVCWHGQRQATEQIERFRAIAERVVAPLRPQRPGGQLHLAVAGARVA